MHTNIHSKNRSAVITNCLRTAMLVGSVALMSACGSGGGDARNVDTVKAEIIPLDHMSNIELQRSASIGTKQMPRGLDNAQGFAAQPAVNDTMSRASRFDLQRLLGMSGESSSDGDEDVVIGTGPVIVSDDDVNSDQQTHDHDDFDEWSDTDEAELASLWDNTGMEQLIDATLGLVGNADVTRNGNTMTIDPDDNELCQQAVFGTQPDFNEMQFCLAMMSDLLVRIDGQTEDSGNISYLFQDETVLQVEYAANQASYKVRLPGVGRVFEKANQLAPDEFDPMPEVFEGVVELGMRSANEALGSEAGAMDVKITAPIVIQDNAAGFNMQLATADLLHFEHDNAAGTASFEMNTNAFLFSFSDGEVVEFAGSGSTVKVDLINDGEQVNVSKLGLGKGPLTLTIDSVEVMKMTLDTFGFNIDSIAQELVLTDGLNFNLMVNLVGGLLGEPQDNDAMIIEASATAPANALFSAQSDGSVRLDNAGPLAIDWLLSFAGVAESSRFSVSPGECFTEDTSGNALFLQVVCQ